jgi:hypothetical protein
MAFTEFCCRSGGSNMNGGALSADPMAINFKLASSPPTLNLQGPSARLAAQIYLLRALKLIASC